MLENIAEYLTDDTKWWIEENSGVKFPDLSKISHTKKLHHFHSSSTKAEENFVKNCRKKCLDKTNLMPAYKVVINDEKHFIISRDFCPKQQTRKTWLLILKSIYQFV